MPDCELLIEAASREFAVPGAAPFVALDKVSLRCPSGSFTALVGPSGCGKSTLLRLLAGLDQPDAGRLLIGGEPPLALQRRGRLGIAFQDAALLPWRTVLDNVRLPLDITGGATAADRQRIRALVELVGLRGFEQALPAQLSGGERQRVALARAFAAEPDVILCDEVTSALDVSVQANVLALIHDLCHAHGTSCLFVAHDIAVVAALCDRVAVLHQGRIVEEGPARSICLTPEHPYTRSLVGAVHRESDFHGKCIVER